MVVTIGRPASTKTEARGLPSKPSVMIPDTVQHGGAVGVGTGEGAGAGLGAGAGIDAGVGAGDAEGADGLLPQPA